MSVIRKSASLIASILLLASSLALLQVPVSADGELIITVDSLIDSPDFVTNSVCSAFKATGGLAPCARLSLKQTAISRTSP